MTNTKQTHPDYLVAPIFLAALARAWHTLASGVAEFHDLVVKCAGPRPVEPPDDASEAQVQKYFAATSLWDGVEMELMSIHYPGVIHSAKSDIEKQIQELLEDEAAKDGDGMYQPRRHVGALLKKHGPAEMVDRFFEP